MTLAIFLAISSGFLWAITNVIDKLIVTRHITKPILVVIFGGLAYALFGALMLPFVKFVSFVHLLMLLTAAGFEFMAALMYFTGMKYEEPSRLVPLLSFITVFIALLSAIFLGEIFGPPIYLGIALVVAGSWIITARKNMFSPFKNRLWGLILLAGLFWAIRFVADKYLLGFYSIITIISLRFLAYGLYSFILGLKYYKEIKGAWLAKRKFIFLQWGNEIIALGAVFCYMTAASLWYVSLVSCFGESQYLFIFLFALILHKIKPNILAEEITKKVAFQKIVAILLIIGGIFIIVL